MKSNHIIDVSNLIILFVFFLKKLFSKCVSMHDRSRFKTLDLPTAYNRDEYTTETLNQYR